MEGFEELREYSVEEVAKHCQKDDCWCVIHGLVYDLTGYLKEHPGGSEVLLEVAGKDATTSFEEIGHSNIARRLAEKFIVGRVKGAKNIRKCFQEKADKRQASSQIQSARGSLATGAVVFAIGLAVCLGVYALQERLFGHHG